MIDRCFSYTSNVKYFTLFFACGVVTSGKLKEEKTAMSAVSPGKLLYDEVAGV